MKLLRAVSRDLLVAVVIIGIGLLGLRIYVGKKIGVAQAATSDFQQLLATNAKQQQVSEYLSKYRAYRTGGDVLVFESPNIYFLPRSGECWNDHLENNLLKGLLQQGIIRLANSLGFSCFRLAVRVGVDSDGRFAGVLDFLPMRGPETFLWANLANTKITRNAPYAVCEEHRSGSAIVRVYPETPKAIASAISAINVGCFRKYDGCSFQEILPTAASQRERDMSHGVDPCF